MLRLDLDHVEQKIDSARHYMLLYSALASENYTWTAGSMDVTDHVSICLGCLPVWTGIVDRADEIDDVGSKYLDTLPYLVAITEIYLNRFFDNGIAACKKASI